MPRPPASPSPPLTSFPYTTGFDFPRASTVEPGGFRSSLLAGHGSLPSLAALREQTAALHAAADPPRERARRTSRRGPLQRAPQGSDTVDYLSRRPPTAHPNRPRATMSERYLRRSQARTREQHAADMGASDLLDSLNEMPSNLFTYANATTRPRSSAVEINSDRQSKRRKLDHAPAVNEYTCFKYGHKGQVVPGRLRMEIVSCDGGEHHRTTPPGLYKVQNVLRNDKSVYCSESSQCNLLLKHIGEAPFALEKVVIRAPERGFTAPIQEGLVFVSMSADELLAGTTAYNLQYTSHSPMTSPTPSTHGEDEELLSFQEAINDPRIWQHSRSDIPEEMEEPTGNLHGRSERLGTEPPHVIASLRSDFERRRVLRQMVENEDEIDGDNCDHGEDDSPAGISAPTPPPFTVTTIASDEEESDSTEEQPSAAIMADRIRRESRWRPDSDDDAADADPLSRPHVSLRRPLPPDFIHLRQRERLNRLNAIRPTHVGLPSRIGLSDSVSNADALKPLARFFIAKNKNKITIKFHPAISGKYILLKFWSPKHDGNIDIESLQFYGYSGPRCFPAMQLR